VRNLRRDVLQVVLRDETAAVGPPPSNDPPDREEP
jgi:hypothetical protein